MTFSFQQKLVYM